MRAVFLDRDGVINRKAPEREYVANWREIEILPGAFEAVATLGRAGYLVFVVTNQRGVATGEIQEAALREIHDRMNREFTNAGGHIKEIYCCMHDLPANCNCRKPKPGMLLQAAHEHQLDLVNCWMVGDSESDIQAGVLAGCKTARIVEKVAVERSGIKADITANNLLAAALQILEWDANPRGCGSCGLGG